MATAAPPTDPAPPETPAGRPAADPILETENLVKSYGQGEARFDALRGLTLQIGRGESVAIVGKSGSGKSTLMHLLALLDRPSHGVVAMDGRPVSELKAKAVAQLRNETFGFVFQQFFLNPAQTVLENVVLPLKIAGVPRSERRRRGMEVLERLELAEKADNRATDLSGGQKQRVCIARALVNNPTVLFADEPTGNLDTATSAVVEDILFGLNRDEGITLVVVTHDEDLAARCGRRVELQDGQIVSDAPVAAPAAGAAPGGHMATADGTASRAAVVGKEEDR
ncbi:ABC transporter ATP-binding protein [Micrococcus lylae]|uniref:ABC transporter ATP-binding protein n=2 Tax=Micrococcus lylae TaxID=1273 RepID=A0ABY2K5M5_9MICC|nr:ABC transporter ATP-binding protein [Micrococcus lylae]TFI01129.1 ABC transporter ATP-binding protein [Micrococcus lylae]